MLLLLLLAAALAFYIYWGNTHIGVTHLAVTVQHLPPEFEGFRIAHISDLHNDEFGPNNCRLVEKISGENPDIIVMTGDILDSRRTNVEKAIAFVRQCPQIAPTYYVPGNHESRLPAEYALLRSAMVESGITVLENQSVPLKRGGTAVTLMGLMDPQFSDPASSLTHLASQATGFTILLSHHPELLDLYAQAGIDLVFSGHAHGGQFRFPLMGGLIAPHQGWFPRYTAGLHIRDNTQLVISRGLGNSLFPFRLNNPPELVLVQLFPGS